MASNRFPYVECYLFVLILFRRQEFRMYGVLRMRKQVNEYVVALAVGYHYAYATVGNGARRVIL